MKKYFLVGSIMLILIGAIVVIATGFNVDIQYRAHKSITVSLTDGINKSDIEGLAKDVLGKQDFIVSEAGLYNDKVIIDVSDINEEQINSLKTKINEKIATVNDKSDEEKNEESSEKTEEEQNEEQNDKSDDVVDVQDVPRVRLTDIASQYVLYTVIATVLVLVYFVIRFFKLGPVKVLAVSVVSSVFAELAFMSLIAITRIAIDKLVIVTAFLVYIISIYVVNKNFEEKLNKQ